MEKQEPKNKKSGLKWYWWVLIVWVTATVIASFLVDKPASPGAAKSAETEQKTEDPLITAYVLSEMYLEKNLKDPDSYEEIEHRKYYVNQKSKRDPYIQVTIKYRAKNSFGGMNIGNVAFNFDREGTMIKMIDLDK